MVPALVLCTAVGLASVTVREQAVTPGSEQQYQVPSQTDSGGREWDGVLQVPRSRSGGVMRRHLLGRAGAVDRLVRGRTLLTVDGPASSLPAQGG